MARGGVNCNFCAKHQDEVVTIIAGPVVYICDECVRLCMEIVEANDIRRTLRLAAYETIGVAHP